jgi:hypothetical protein
MTGTQLTNGKMTPQPASALIAGEALKVKHAPLTGD